MGAGLAKTLAASYPQLAHDYRERCRASNLRPGQVYYWPGKPGIVNLCTQEGFRGASASYVMAAFESLRDLILDHSIPIRTLALPQVAAGLGGLSWETVLPIIVQKLGKLPIEIYIYNDFKTGVPGREAA